MSTIAKAIVGALAAAAAYLVGVIPAEGGFGDLSTVQWVGLVPVLLGAFGIVWSIPNKQAGEQ
jgi:hypothetical protein